MKDGPATTVEVAASQRKASLDRALVQGIAWTGAVRWASHIVTWAATIATARILSPEDFGIWALAGVYLGIVTLLSDFGLGASIVMIPRLTRAQVAQINGFAILMGFAAVLITCALAWPIGQFLRAPQLAPVLAVMSVTFLITGLRITPAALLQKEFRFKALALIDGARAILHSLAIVAFALLGFRYWSLVAGSIVSVIVWTAAVLALSHPPIARPRLASIRDALRFSTDVGVSRLLWYFYSNADFVIAGRVLGKGPLGAYSLAWTLASVPIEKVSALVVRVTPALFTAVHHNLADLRRYLLTITEGIALIVFPACIGLALTADDFVAVVLGAKWEAAIVPMRLLASYAVVRSISPMLAQVLNALGESRTVLWNSALMFLLLPPAFLVGSRWGTAGIAAAWIVVHPLPLLFLYARTFRRIELPAVSYLRCLWPATSATLVMIGVVLTVRMTVAQTLPAPARLAAEVGAGAATYLAVLLLVHRRRIAAFRRVLAAATARVP